MLVSDAVRSIAPDQTVFTKVRRSTEVLEAAGFMIVSCLDE